MPITDFTLNNPLIKDFLEGKSTYVPSGELVYIHTHLIQHNFLSEIETMLSIAHQVIDTITIKPKWTNRLLQAYMDLADILPNLNQETAPRILHILKDVYQISKHIIEQGPPLETNNETATVE